MNKLIHKTSLVALGLITVHAAYAFGDGDAARYLSADLNGDGKADVLFIGTDGSVHGRLSGGGSSWEGVAPLTGFGDGNPARYLSADLDGDGRGDALFIGADGSVHGRVFDGSSSWGGTTPLTGFGDGDPARYLSADLNGDGKADVLFIGTDGSVHGRLSDGGSSWTGTTPLTGFGDGTPSRYLSSDLNGDGKADVLFIGTDGSVHGRLSDGGSSWTGTTPLTGFGDGTPSRYLSSDLNGDGKADVLFIGTDGSVHGRLSDGGSSWSGTEPIWGFGDGNPTHYSSADLNGDGKSDIVFIGTDGSAHGRLSDGGSSWSGTEPIYGFGDGNMARYLLSDVNADGAIDVLFVAPQGAIHSRINTDGGLSWVAGAPLDVPPPDVSASVSAVTITLGTAVNFTVTSSSQIGLSEVGVGLRDGGGAITTNLGAEFVSGSPVTKSFTWTPDVVGTFYVVGYAWNSDRTQLGRSAVMTVTVQPQPVIIMGYVDLPVTVSRSTSGSSETIHFSINDGGTVGSSSTYTSSELVGEMKFRSYDTYGLRSGPGYALWIVRTSIDEIGAGASASRSYYYYSIVGAFYIKESRSWERRVIGSYTGGGSHAVYAQTYGFSSFSLGLSSISWTATVSYYSSFPSSNYSGYYEIPKQKL